MKRIRATKRGHISPAIGAGIAVFAVLLSASAALAADHQLNGKFRTGDTVTIDAGDTFEDNLYAFAGSVNVDGTVEGDLVVASGSISIDGTVTGDVVATGGQLTISGRVDGDVRFAGGQLDVTGDVGGDVAVVGGMAEVGGTVGSDVLFAAGQMNLSGDVAGSVLGSSGGYERSGTVAGAEDVTMPDEPSFGDRVSDGLFRFASLFLVGVAVMFFLSRALERVVTRATVRPWWSLLFGLIAVAALLAGVVVLIIVGVIVSIVFGLLGLGLLLGTYWFAFAAFLLALVFVLFLLWIYAAPAVTVLTAARLLLPDRMGLGPRLLAFALGLIVYVIVTSIPFIGGLISLLTFLFAAGAIVLAIRNFGAREPVAAPADI